MSNNWINSLGKLRQFISQNSGISIQEKIVRIDTQVRPEFYRLFDTVLSNFADEKLGHITGEIIPISGSYGVHAETLSAELGLEAILQPTEIAGLLKNPKEKANSILFDRLFRLLKDKYDVAAFERESINAVSLDFNYHLDFLYLSWTVTALLKMLQPKRFLRVPLRHTVAKDVMNDQGGDKAASLEVPSAEASKTLDFQHDPDTMLNMADVIVYSEYLHKYVSLRAGIAPALRTASNRSQKREWIPIDNLILDTSLMPIYVADKPDDISLVLDNEAMCRPEAVVCCWGKSPENAADAFLRLRKMSEVLKPKYGIWVIAYHDFEYSFDNDIRLLHAGTDPMSLLPLLAALSTENKSET